MDSTPVTSSSHGIRRRWYLASAVVVVAAAAAVWLVGPRLAGPPRTITLATGLEGGAYAALGPRYQKILARNGITVRLLSTSGDVDNLSKLRDPRSGVSAAFVQAGIASDAEKDGLASLGTLMYSPLWVFERHEHSGFGIGNLAGQRVSIGPEGSGTRFQALKLLALEGVDLKAVELKAYTPAAAEKALDREELDAAIIVVGWESPVIQRLMANPRLWLVNFPRADAFVALRPYLTKLVIPMGVGDLAKNLPRTDVALLSTKVSLLIREDLHPALQYLLLDAATEIHSGPALFQHAGQFPAGEAMDVPLSSDAQHFYKTGPPFLYRYFPFWLAVLVERLLLLLIPVVGLLYPLARVVPSLYFGVMQRRIVVLYKELKRVERELDAGQTSEATLVRRVDNVLERANRLRVPLVLSQNLYHLKAHIQFVRQRIAENAAALRHPRVEGSGVGGS
ncbi:MAG: TAXI family TRAP transporter solute-binding subunit [Myxococcaceae bacterium]